MDHLVPDSLYYYLLLPILPYSAHHLPSSSQNVIKEKITKLEGQMSRKLRAARPCAQPLPEIASAAGEANNSGSPVIAAMQGIGSDGW